VLDGGRAESGWVDTEIVSRLALEGCPELAVACAGVGGDVETEAEIDTGWPWRQGGGGWEEINAGWNWTMAGSIDGHFLGRPRPRRSAETEAG